jgi:hypothetical protein
MHRIPPFCAELAISIIVIHLTMHNQHSKFMYISQFANF